MRAVFDAVCQDVRHAVRGYLRSPLFTLTAIATLTVGIGSTTAIFGVVEAVVLRPLPYPQAAGLVAVSQRREETRERLAVAPPNYFDLKEWSRDFEALAAYNTTSVTLAGAGGDPEKLRAAAVFDDLFAVMRVAPALGRGFGDADMAPGAPHVAVISHGLWVRRFAADPAVLGRTSVVDNQPTVIVGVMPGRFDFPARGTDVWLPMRLSRVQPPNPGIPASAYRGYRILSVVARLRDGLSLDAARADVAGVGGALQRAYPDANRGLTLAVTSLQDESVGSARSALLVLFAAVGCLMLIAAANTSNLVLVRAAARTREMAIRRAVGASRGRLIAQAVTESVVLALAGGAASLLFASWAIDAFVRLAPAGIPRIEDVRVDSIVALFAFAVASVAGVLCGVAPALHEGGEREALGRRGTTPTGVRTRHGLVVAQVALSTVLLTGASLLAQSFVRLARVDTGFRPADAVIVDRIELPRTREALARSGRFFEQLVTQIGRAPGIDAAGATLGLPLDARARFYVDETRVAIGGRAPLPVAQQPTAALHVVSGGVSGGYFAAAGVPLKSGRWFDDRDRGDSPGVAIVNETMARRHWPGEDPIGRTLSHDLTILPGYPSVRRIVGVVGDVHHFGLEGAPEPQMFIPHAQMPWPSMALVIRTSLPIERVNGIVRDAVHGLDATIPVPPPVPLQQMVAGAVGQPRFRAILIGLFAGAALLLALVGLYGTTAFNVNLRTRELGLRIALGASPDQLTRMVLGAGLTLAAAGAAIGIVVSAAASRAIATMLYGVGANDPATFIVTPLALIVVAAAACYVPARRIRRIEPLKALTSGAE